ncbi:MAG TPA: hypothetical protein VFZ65_19220 [Planctomycetota bacterium]|nr:hypothetical protein [Planctomycetota bacterium]
MRTIAVTALASLFTGCASTVMAEPKILVSPYLAVYQLRGKTSLQSPTGPGQPPQDNAPQTMRQFGQDHHHEDVGVRADIGDGFAGFRIDYYKLDMGTSHKDFLNSNWGNLLASDLVSMTADMDELRIGYLEPLLRQQVMYREQPLVFRVAGGGVFAYRDMVLRAKSDDLMRMQNLAIDGNVIYGALRCQATWRDFAIDFDYAISPGLALGGDYEGLQQDVEVRGSYTLSMRDITLFAGYRYSEFPAEGTHDNLAFDADLAIDGFQFGFAVTF